LLFLAAGTWSLCRFFGDLIGEQVILLVVLFSYQAHCCRADLQILVLAALAHDLGHQGQRVSTGPSASEAASAWRACQLNFRRGADCAACNHLTRLVIATSSKPNISRSDQLILSHQTSPSLAALLSDADLFPSHNYGRKTQVWLAAKVKFEQRSPLPVETILSNFLAKTRLQSPTARGLVITN
jgi:hypothetical protein